MTPSLRNDNDFLFQYDNDRHLGGVSIGRKTYRNAAGDGAARLRRRRRRQGKMWVQKQKTGETAGKGAKTAHG